MLNEVDVSMLKQSIETCKSNINYEKTKESISEITNGGIWVCSSREKLNEALSNLIDKKYKKLEELLDNYLSVVDYIENFQNNQKEIEMREKQILSLQDNLYTEETTINEDGEEVIEEVKNEQIEYEINGLTSEIENLKKEQNQLQMKIEEMI